MKRTTKEYHKCTLKKDKTLLTLPPLPPNATLCQKSGRWFRKQCLLNLNSKRCQVLFNNQSSRKAELRRHAKSPYFYIIHPFSRVNFLIEVIFLVVWISEIILYPLEHSIFYDAGFDYQICELLLSILRLCLIVIFFFVGYVDYKKRVVVIEPKRIVLHYLRTYFCFDVIGTVGEEAVRYIPRLLGIDSNEYADHIVVFSVVFLAQIARTPDLIRVLRNIYATIGMTEGLNFVIFHLSTGLIYLHFLTCFVFGASRKYYSDHFQKHDSFNNQSWMHIAGVDSRYTPKSLIYNRVALVVTCYFLGAQHGMYSVTLAGEQFVFFILALLGRLYTLFIVADLLRFFGLVKVSESKYEQYMVQLEEFMRSKNLPAKMKAKLTRYYEYKFQKEFFDEGEIFEMLSDHLRTELFLFGARKLIDKIGVFRKLPRANLAAFISQMRAETFLPNDIIIKTGDLICEICFISSGTVAVLHEFNELTHLVDGAVMGLVSMYKHQQKIHYFSYVAVEITEIYSIDKDSFIKFLEVNPEVNVYFASKAEQVAWNYEIFKRRNVFLEGDGVMDSLRSGRLLEKPRLRPMVLDA